MRTQPKSRGAFTLVELLVVIGIIALLISILLPALNTARRAAQSVACLANLRSAGQAMIMFTAENKGDIPGSANTSGKMVMDASTGNTNPNWKRNGTVASDTNVPEGDPIGIYDWVQPLAKMMKIKLSTDPSVNVRFDEYRRLKAFLCPNNTFSSSPFSGTNWGTEGPMLSYTTATAFMLRPRVGSGQSGKDYAGGSPYWNVPATYAVKITKVGPSSTKIFMADGAKYTTCSDTVIGTISAFKTPFGTDNHQYNPFSDYGAFFGNTKCWDRAAAAPGSITILRDARIFAFRHGSPRSNTYRLNAVFFDGHAETMDDFAAANPALWLPTGCVFTSTTAAIGSRQMITQDVITKMGLPSTNYVVP